VEHLLVTRLRAALPAALRARDAPAVAALRSALAAVANAQAVPAPDRAGRGLGIGPDTALGVGTVEVPRRELTSAQVAAIVRAEVEDRRAAARGYAEHGRPERARRLRAEADALEAVLAGAAG
jgi:uncharacterized protein